MEKPQNLCGKTVEFNYLNTLKNFKTWINLKTLTILIKEPYGFQTHIC